MKTLFDTSVLVPALSSDHINYTWAAPWLRRPQASQFPWFVAAHSLAECYTTLTANAKLLRVPPVKAEEMIRKNLTASAAKVELTAAEYEDSIHMAASQQLTSGVVYDAILLPPLKRRV